MDTLAETAAAFVPVAHRIVWAAVATVDSRGRPRSRVLHPIWERDGERLTGWIATGPTPVKRSHLERSPFASVNYWDAAHDVATAECRATWHFDDETRIRIWDLFKGAPAPVGYDPAIVPAWTSPTGPEFAVLRLDPWRLRVFPGSRLLTGRGRVFEWSE